MYIITTGATVSFNGEISRIILNIETGITSITINVNDVYNKWKEWVINQGSKYLKAFDLLGGNPIDDNKIISYYYVLSNNWKIIVETNSTNYIELILNGNIITDDNSFIFSLNEFIGKIYIRTLISANILTTDMDNINESLDIINNNLIDHRLKTEDKIKYILGLSQQNFRVKDQIYNENNLLTYSKIRIYNNNIDAENDNNFLKEYEMSSEYDNNGKLINYIVKEI